MNVIEFCVFCIGIATVSFAIGVIASALGCKFGKYLVKRGNNMEKTYTYCERCGKPVEPKNNNHYDICGNCAAILLKKIFNEEKKYHGK